MSEEADENEQRLKEMEEFVAFGLSGGPVPGPAVAEAPRDISVNIRSRRRMLNLTQEAVARRLGVTKSLVGHWESGRSRVMVSDLERLAGILQTTVSTLLSSDPMPPPSMSRAQTRRQLLMSLYDDMNDTERDRLLYEALAIMGLTGPSADREIAAAVRGARVGQRE